ncbi:MAG: GH3 auxin-responsive promoter family protein [Bdellovibrionales bacterium]|nr:GH3 auxin-responsive promoter family protein [Bdellovibrionales bacterium]
MSIFQTAAQHLWVRPLAWGLRRAWLPLAAETEASAHDPRVAQDRALKNILALCGSGEAGCAWGLQGMRALEDLRELPTTAFPDVAPWVARVREEGRAGSGVFGRSRPLALGQTSGTTGESKRFPVTREFLASYRRSTHRLNAAYFASTGAWSEAATAKNLILAARPELGRGPGGLAEGFMSGIMSEAVPPWIRMRTLPSRALTREGEWDAKLDRVIDQATRHRVRLMAGVPPLMMAFSERALARRGARCLREIWPDLRTLYFGGLALSDAARERFREIIGRKDLVFWELYAATEGQFGHSLRVDLPGMVFTSLENVFTFTEWPRAGRVLLLHELRAGGRYSLRVTTPGGLVNYRMGDLIEVLSERPLTFRVCGRESDEISLAGEKIVTEQAEAALSYAAVRMGGRRPEYALWAEEGKPHHLVWALEGIGLDESSTWMRFLDEGLRGANPTYSEMRKQDFIFAGPRLRPLEEGVFRDYRNRNLDRGQFKGRRIFVDERAFLSEVMGGESRHHSHEVAPGPVRV